LDCGLEVSLRSVFYNGSFDKKAHDKPFDKQALDKPFDTKAHDKPFDKQAHDRQNTLNPKSKI